MEQHVYQKNFLVDVIFRIDYPPILSLVTTLPSVFQEKIFSDFPLVEPIQQQGIIIDTQGGEHSSQRIQKTTWRFTSKDGTKAIEVDSEYLVIGVKAYTSYLDFKAFVTRINALFFEIYPEVVINRMGLRYVNRISLQEENIFDWSEKIDPNLIAPLNFIENKDYLRGANTNFILALNDATTLNIRCGIGNSIFPAKPNTKEFIIDLDCSTNVQFDKNEIIPKLDDYNAVLTKYFENSIGPSLRSLMN